MEAECDVYRRAKVLARKKVWIHGIFAGALRKGCEPSSADVVGCGALPSRDEAVLNIQFGTPEHTTSSSSVQYWMRERGASFSTGYDSELAVQVQISTAPGCEL